MERDRDGGSQRSRFHVAFATTDKVAYHHGCSAWTGGDCELFAGCRVYTSSVRAGIASILPPDYHCIAVHAYKRCCCLRRCLRVTIALLAKPAFTGRNFSFSFVLGIDRAYHLAAVKANRAGEQFLQRRCAISERSRAEGCLADAWAIHSFCIAHASCKKHGKKAMKDRVR